MTDYTHFTSPIRRYADFIVHRIFDAYLYRNALPTAPREAPPVYNPGQLASIAEHISLTEQNSTEAERQSVKNRQLEFFELEADKKPKTPFEAVITDVKNHGFFVELTQSMAYGFVHISSLVSDFYVLSEDSQSLVGRRTQQKFSIGDKIFIVVDKVDRYRRQMDFLLADKSGNTVPPMPAQQRPPPHRRRVAPRPAERTAGPKPQGRPSPYRGSKRRRR